MTKDSRSCNIEEEEEEGEEEGDEKEKWEEAEDRWRRRRRKDKEEQEEQEVEKGYIRDDRSKVPVPLDRSTELATMLHCRQDKPSDQRILQLRGHRRCRYS